MPPGFRDFLSDMLTCNTRSIGCRYRRCLKVSAVILRECNKSRPDRITHLEPKRRTAHVSVATGVQTCGDRCSSVSSPDCRQERSIMGRHHIVILGGGFAGLYTAMELEKASKNDPDTTITL